MPYTAAANCSAMPDPYLRDLMSDCNLMADLSFLLALLGYTNFRVETGPPKRKDEPRAAHGRARAGCRRMRSERDGTRLLPIGFSSCFLSGLQAADRDCELVDREHELAVMRTEAEVI
ncbi:hypothetical protein DY000_02030277 [Brassica cretica]|uniref:Uncharacterized protein n=1 Tax=Brassica cretica TaxID=69181 RepID=A0ABQ7E0B2_BRACR|nr:hypothetical protein DY000_02030277 [Brassica cretica]